MKLINKKNTIISILGIGIYIYTFAINVSTDKNTYSEAINTTNIQPGLWFDPSKNGHGFAIEPIGFNDLYFTVFFTYKDDGTPEWYTSLATLENGVLNINLENNTLQRFNYDFSINPEEQGTPIILDESISNNMLSIDFNSTTIANNDACNDTTNSTTNRATNLFALATWQLGEQAAVSWCIQPLISLESYPKPDFGGIWWTGIDDTGWGISIAFASENIVVVVYYYDSDGTPRWVLGQATDFESGQEISINLLEHHGYARNAEPIVTTNVIAGTIALNLNSV
ncbi:MAG: hypothetical protein L3J83_10780 [Proteobacteria bacterium]|nr:hypothetical protein [Pseudomonadota bacterium]